MKIEIKSFDQLNTRELYALLKLRVDVFVVEQNCPYPELGDKDEVSMHFLCYEGDELASYLRTYERVPGEYGIGRIVTDAKHRGKGLAAQLIKQAMDHIKGLPDAQRIVLQAQSHLTDYYGGFGFQICSEEYLEDDIPHTDLALDL